MFLPWTWTLNVIYIESSNALCKQKTGKLCSSLCPKLNLRNSCSKKLLNFGFFFRKLVPFHLYGGLEIALEVVKMSKCWSLKESGASYKLRFIHADNAAHNILRKLKKMKPTWTGRGKWYLLWSNFSLLLLNFCS